MNVTKSNLFIDYFNSEIQRRFYRNTFLITKTSLNINENEIKEIDTTIKDEDNDKNEYNPIVYIYNTHETENYKNEFKSEYSITPDVKLASYILKEYLNDYDIDSYVETKSTIEYVKKNKNKNINTTTILRIQLPPIASLII